MLLLLAGVLPAWSHHTTAHGGAMGAAFTPLSAQGRPPATFLELSTAYDRLDGNLGAVATYQFAGEYSVTPRTSVGGRVPVVSVWEDFLPTAHTIGDVALSIKHIVGAWPTARRAVQLSAELSVPTGDEIAGTGSGAIAVSPVVTLRQSWHRLTFVLSAGSSVAATAPVRPSLEYAASLLAPLTSRTSRVPLAGVLALQGSTAPASATLADWSTKIYCKPALTLHLRQHWLASLGAKISVIDTLRTKPGVALSLLSTAPLSDVTVGGFASLAVTY